MNVATALPQTRFNALLIDGEKAVLESGLREEGCSVRRVSSRTTAIESLLGMDLVVISPNTLPDDEVLDIASKAVAQGVSTLVVAASTELAIRATKVGAAVVIGNAIELAQAQIGQLCSVIELKRKVARTASSSSISALAGTSPTSGVVQRRSAPLPKEATPDALDALIEAAEGLVPMHKFQRVYVDYALRRFGGNKVHTAAALGIDRRTIQRWARARGGDRPVATTTTNTNTSSTSSN